MGKLIKATVFALGAFMVLDAGATFLREAKEHRRRRK
jgi:hypothetical protein